MELLVASIAILLALVVTAGVMDLRARRTRRRLSVDGAAARDARRLNQSRSEQYGAGSDRLGGGFGFGP